MIGPNEGPNNDNADKAQNAARPAAGDDGAMRESVNDPNGTNSNIPNPGAAGNEHSDHPQPHELIRAAASAPTRRSPCDDGPIPVTELEFSDRLVAATNGRLRFVPKQKRWYAYNGILWVGDQDVEDDEHDDGEDGAAWVEATGLARRYAAQAERQMARAQTRQEQQQAAEEVRQARKWLTHRSLANSIKLASKEREITMRATAFDRDPYTLHCNNGIVDLRTGDLNPHDKLQYNTKSTYITYDPDAEAPLWNRFLEKVLPDCHIRDYVQKLVGLSLFGTIYEHIVPVLLGEGRNGKGVFYSMLLRCLKDYAASLADTVLMSSAHPRHPTELVPLVGARIAFASETDEESKFATAKLKTLSGGDPVKCHKMYRDMESHDPTHTIWLVTNHLPRLTADDKAVWERVRVVRFPITIAENERDKHLQSKLENELPGILTWAVDGAVKYWKKGCKAETPKAVLCETESYRDNEDELGHFIFDEVIVEQGGFIRTGEMFSRYESWAQRNGYKALGQRTLSSRLKSRLTYSQAPRGWKNVRLRTSAAAQAWSDDDDSEMGSVGGLDS